MKEVLVRALSGLAYVALIIGSALYSQSSFYIVFYILMLFSLFEFKRLIKLKYNWAYVVATLIYLRFSNLEIINKEYVHFLLIASLFFPFIYQLFKPKIDITSSKIGHYSLAIVYIALPFTFMTLIPFFNGDYHPKIIISIFALIWANDTFAYIVGRAFGKTKLFEKVSPNKTIEGALGGLIAGLIAAYFFAKYFTILSITNWMIIAVIVTIFGILGDLIESKFKREAQVKDSGNFIPGHGGFLDRLDSIIFAAPFVYVYLHLINPH